MSFSETAAISEARALARNLQYRPHVRAFMIMALIGVCGVAMAQDQVLLQEILPQYAGSEFGGLPIADAPVLGSTLVVRRSDVLRAMKQAGVPTSGVVIPLATRVSRKLVRLGSDVVLAASEQALAEAAQPCTIVHTRIPNEVSVNEGPRSVRAELGRVLRSGSVSGSIVIESAGREIRVPLLATVTCPEPDVSTGKQLTVFVVVGDVTVSAPGEAKQNGRVGDVIRVQNRATGAALQARIVDPGSAQVVP